MAASNKANEAQTTDKSDNGPRCANFGERVTREYHRVLSDNEGVLRSCLHCTGLGVNRDEPR